MGISDWATILYWFIAGATWNNIRSDQMPYVYSHKSKRVFGEVMCFFWGVFWPATLAVIWFEKARGKR